MQAAGHSIKRFDCPHVREAFQEIDRPSLELKRNKELCFLDMVDPMVWEESWRYEG